MDVLKINEVTCFFKPNKILNKADRNRTWKQKTHPPLKVRTPCFHTLISSKFKQELLVLRLSDAFCFHPALRSSVSVINFQHFSLYVLSPSQYFRKTFAQPAVLPLYLQQFSTSSKSVLSFLSNSCLLILLNIVLNAA